jgi:hypothetical protein
MVISCKPWTRTGGVPQGGTKRCVAGFSKVSAASSFNSNLKMQGESSTETSATQPTTLVSVCPCIIDDTKRLKPTRCYTMVLLNLMNRSTCFGHHCAHHQELATCNIPLTGRSNLQPSTRPATCHNQSEVPHAGAVCIVESSWWWAQCCPKHVLFEKCFAPTNISWPTSKKHEETCVTSSWQLCSLMRF